MMLGRRSRNRLPLALGLVAILLLEGVSLAAVERASVGRRTLELTAPRETAGLLALPSEPDTLAVAEPERALQSPPASAHAALRAGASFRAAAAPAAAAFPIRRARSCAVQLRPRPPGDPPH